MEKKIEKALIGYNCDILRQCKSTYLYLIYNDIANFIPDDFVTYGTPDAVRSGNSLN